uniref:NAC domain-containing protein n=1 Tax=Triticum urartu TaxID=4572 RepID=A0A8R7QNQ4_TRIUA
MIAGEPLPEAAARFLHTADAYGADPAALVSGLLPAVPLAPKTGAERRCWYFFCSAKALSGHDKRRSRAVGGGEGTWHAEKGRAALLHARPCRFHGEQLRHRPPWWFSHTPFSQF